ncbi:MAG: glutamate---cysteine ligase / carboxylate-amine ligase [Solirubrobacteraceae bacterium]|jgi:carboxylate-amine ligase|nr:glutamate---cysteine ligase / carboxylate-amine ligase [Solirubrobacteraceae bacterium]
MPQPPQIPDPPRVVTAESLHEAFDAPAPLTVGVEEELMVLDPATLDLAPLGKAVLAAVGDDPRFKLEFPAAQLEIVTAPASGAGAVAAQLAAARRDLAAAAGSVARFAGTGLHPFAAPDGPLNEGERYARTMHHYGPVAARQQLCALQVHVAVRGAGRALAVHNALRSFLPELAALAANAPYHDGRDTGMASARPKVSELLPRQGIPPVLGGWAEFAEAMRWGAAAGPMVDYRSWWFELRPNPAFGTLEVRVPDAQATVAEAAAVVAVVHALAAWLAARHDAGDLPTPAPAWRIAENRWSAAHRGPHGEMADLDSGAPGPTADRLHALLDVLEPIARDQAAADHLATARNLIDRPGADRQRAAGDPHAATAQLAADFLAGI